MFRDNGLFYRLKEHLKRRINSFQNRFYHEKLLDLLWGGEKNKEEIFAKCQGANFVENQK